MAASAEEELEQLQHLNLGGLDSRDGVLDEVRAGGVGFILDLFITYWTPALVLGWSCKAVY